MRTIAFINQKGGVGKTTTTVNVGASLAASKKKVLLIDLDPQAHLTQSLGLEDQVTEFTIYDLLKSRKKDKKALILGSIIKRGHLSIIPSIIDLAGAEMELSSIPGRELLLKEILQELQDYDYILLDCPPSLGLLTLNAITSADEIFVPVQSEFLALQGMSQLIDTIELVETRLNRGVAITGVIATRYDKRKKLNRDAVNKLKEHFPNQLFETVIRENIALAEAPSHGKTIFEYREDSFGAEDYKSLTKEYLARIKSTSKIKQKIANTK